MSNSTRTNIFIKIVGLVFLILGITTAFYTNSTLLVQPLVGVFFLIAALLIGSGLFVLLADLK